MNPTITETTTTSYAPLPALQPIPFLDVRAAYLELKDSIDAAVAGVLERGTYILGPEVESFEEDFARYVGASHCVGISNGLDALHLALRALNVGPGDEVIVPANTYIATWLAVSHAGARPVPIDPDPLTYNLDPARIAQAITPRTRGIIGVHLYGQPVEADTIRSIAHENGLWFMEDAAQAHGARYRGVPAGSLGDIACWSFYPGKNLGACGDGGAITTNRADLADKVRVLRNYGSRLKYQNECKGFNSRLDSMQAAILRCKLPHLDEWNQRRQGIAALYNESLRNTHLVLPVAPSWLDHVYHLYVVRSPQRDQLLTHLQSHGITTLIHYPIAPHLQPAYQDLGLKQGDLPVSERLQREVLSLPMGPQMTREQALRVIEAVRDFDQQFSSY